MLSSFRLAGEIDFPYLEQVFRMEKKSIEVKTGKHSEQTIYGMRVVTCGKVWSRAIVGINKKPLAHRKRITLSAGRNF